MSCFVQTCDQVITGMKNTLDFFKVLFSWLLDLFLTGGTRGLDFARIRSRTFFSEIHDVQLTLTIITGRQFSFGRALQIIQDETYLEDSDFDEIRKIGQFDANMNIPKTHQKWISKTLEYKHLKWRTHNTNVKSGHSHRVKR